MTDSEHGAAVFHNLVTALIQATTVRGGSYRTIQLIDEWMEEDESGSLDEGAAVVLKVLSIVGRHLRQSQ